MNNLPEDKQIVMNQVLSQPLIARLATADQNNQPHVVPVWFGWDGEYSMDQLIFQYPQGQRFAAEPESLCGYRCFRKRR